MGCDVGRGCAAGSLRCSSAHAIGAARCICHHRPACTACWQAGLTPPWVQLLLAQLMLQACKLLLACVAALVSATCGLAPPAGGPAHCNAAAGKKQGARSFSAAALPCQRAQTVVWCTPHAAVSYHWLHDASCGATCKQQQRTPLAIPASRHAANACTADTKLLAAACMLLRMFAHARLLLPAQARELLAPGMAGGWLQCLLASPRVQSVLWGDQIVGNRQTHKLLTFVVSPSQQS
jgi:hypothetical protein